MGKDRFDIKEKEGISLMTDAVVIVVLLCSLQSVVDRVLACLSAGDDVYDLGDHKL